MLRAAAAGALAVLALAGPGVAGLAPSRILAWNGHTHVARLTLLAGLGGENNGFNFDGYGRGELLIAVPLGSRVTVDCENRGGRNASCAVISGALATTPAFPGAASPDAAEGLDPGAKATFSFRATRAGSFRIASLVPGQEQARMFAVLVVRHVARPSVSVRPGP
jgi:hypothetical protein